MEGPLPPNANEYLLLCFLRERERERERERCLRKDLNNFLIYTEIKVYMKYLPFSSQTLTIFTQNKESMDMKYILF